jgi:GNAT superfamily N-acetyltransferase
MDARQALPDDAATVLSWLNCRELWAIDNPDPYRKQSLHVFAPQWQAMLHHHNVWMLEDADRVIGQAGWVQPSPEHAELFITIAQPLDRRRGYGSQILDWLEHQVRNGGQSVLSAQVLGNNRAGYDFFSKHGYRQTACLEQRVIRDDKRYPLYRLEKQLA